MHLKFNISIFNLIYFYKSVLLSLLIIIYSFRCRFNSFFFQTSNSFCCFFCFYHLCRICQVFFFLDEAFLKLCFLSLATTVVLITISFLKLLFIFLLSTLLFVCSSILLDLFIFSFIFLMVFLGTFLYSLYLSHVSLNCSLSSKLFANHTYLLLFSFIFHFFLNLSKLSILFFLGVYAF